MNDDAPIPEKSCDPQLSESEIPSNLWDLHRLTAYAKVQYAQVIDGERTLAPGYWRLGNGLHFLRKNFAHGQWTKFLEEHGIDKTRASKALAIHRAFETVEQVEGLTVDEAYKARFGLRLKRAMPIGERQESSTNLKSVAQAAKSIDRLVAEVSELSPDEKQQLRSELRQTIAHLQAQLKKLEAWLDADLASTS